MKTIERSSINIEHLHSPLWSIGAEGELVDNYKEPNLPGDVVWRVPTAGENQGSQRWPLFHPSEADPDGGYRARPHTILFALDDQVVGDYLLTIDYLVIAPRLAYLEIRLNGTSGLAHLRPAPSRSGEIRLLSGLHTTIYSDGRAEVVIPGALLKPGENRLELIARDGGEVLHVDRIEAVRRLDRMANGAGLIYEYIGFAHGSSGQSLRHVEVMPTVMYRKDSIKGELTAGCFLYVETNGPLQAGEWTLQLWDSERTEAVAVTIPESAFGHHQIPFDLFDGEGEVHWRRDGALHGQPDVAAERESGPVATGTFRRRRKWNVYLTPHAHTDIGYTHRQWEVAERLCRNIDTALDILQEQRDFTYHLDSAWPLELYWATRGPRRKAQFIQQMQAGRIGVAGIYVDLLTQTSGLEDLIRNAVQADLLLRPHQLTTDFASVVDVASLSSSLPAVLEGSGIKYLVHANNQDRGPFRLNGGLHKISPFYWEGQAGGRVLVWLAKMYCELRKVCGSPPVLSSAERGLGMWLQEYETDAYAPDAVMLYGQEADNTDLDPQPVSFIQRWNSEYAYPQLIPCDVSQFFHYVEERFGDRLATVKGDGGAYWEDGAGSSIEPTIRVRAAQAALPAAERLEALAAIHTPDWAFPLEHFDAAWRDLLLYDEHTWGAFLSCREPDALLATDQWAVKEGFARLSDAWAKRLLHVAAVRHSLNWNNDGREVVVYNPHNWQVTSSVTIELEPNEVVIDPRTGQPAPQRRTRVLPTQVLVEVLVDRLDGLSYRRFVLARVPVAELGQDRVEQVGSGPAVLENRWYRICFDPARGCVTSWFDKTLGRELVDVQNAYGFGQLLYAHGGEGTRLVSNQSDLLDGDPQVLAQFELGGCEIRHYSYGSSLVMTGQVPSGHLTVEWRLTDKAPQLDLRFTYHKQVVRAKEAVYVAFPLDLPSAAVSSDSQLGWVDWHRDQLPGGCKEWLPLQTGIHVAASDVQVLVCSPDIPLFTVGDVVQGRWPKELDLTGGHVFSYVLNNYWHTNYKAEQGGEISFAYRLTSGARIDKDQAYRTGWEARRGLYGHRMSFQDFRPGGPDLVGEASDLVGGSVYLDSGGGTLARIGSDQVALTTMAQARRAAGFVLRLQEIGGADRIAPVAIPGRPIQRAWLTDLLEQDLEELSPEADGTLLVPVRAWGLATVRIELVGPAPA